MEIEYTNERCPFIEKFLIQNELEIDNLQSFTPCIDQKVDTKVTKWTSIQLEKRIFKVTSRKDYRGIIKDSHKKEYETHFHIKCTPILEPSCLCRNEYTSFLYHHWLPTHNKNKFVNLFHKVNNNRNSAYIDTLCSIFLNKLSCLNYTPHFGEIYGVYSGIMTDYEEEITEDYESLKAERWFNKILNSGKYRVKTVSDKNNKILKKKLSSSELCDLDKYAIEIPKHSIPMKQDIDEDAKQYLIHPKIPVQIVFMQKFDNTFDHYVKQYIEEIRNTHNKYVQHIRKKLLMNKMTSWIFQITAGLCCANTHLDFVHNDLHVQNVMGIPTNQKYLYYNQNGIIYKVPTYGYIMKIIDFGRSTYVVNGKYYIGDVFDEDGEAGGQYTVHPLHKSSMTSQETINPNPSFDLARFSCSFIEDLDDELWPTENDLNDYEIGRLLNAWTINDVGESLMDIEGFELYINIARFFRKKTPESQIKEEVFKKYRTFDAIPDDSTLNIYLI